jgi:hypothetical protein
LASGPTGGTFFLGTTGPDGRPHAQGVGAVWLDGDLYFVSGPGTRKSRNLACTVSASLPGIDIVIEGEASRVTEAATLEWLAAHYRETGWPTVVQGDAFTAPYSAPSAGPHLGICTPSPSTRSSASAAPSRPARHAGASSADIHATPELASAIARAWDRRGVDRK